ncbi:MAG: NAD(P)-dependent oxidoreductase [Isosphaeraceae bacterium]|nr:NAD(P)-dependent oxidoreductase [Isosphaeraceae bacterium]
MPVWLVTGGSGFLGRHLLAALRASAPSSVEVVALGRRPPADWPAEAFLRADLDDLPALARLAADLAPEVVFHAAGLTPPAAPHLFYKANTGMTANLLAALRACGRSVRVVLAGSAAELGPVPVEDLPVAEDYPCRPADAYGLSKWAASYLGRTMRPPLEVVTARIFNPIGPGLPPTQALGRFAAKLAEPGPDPLRLVVGDLDSRRDFLDIRDVAVAMIALAHRGHAGLVYHVGSGRSRRVGEGLDDLIQRSGRSIEVIAQPGVRRGPADSRADIRRITEHTSWAPRIAWEQSLADLWDEARSRAMASSRRVT